MSLIIKTEQPTQMLQDLAKRLGTLASAIVDAPPASHLTPQQVTTTVSELRTPKIAERLAEQLDCAHVAFNDCNTFIQILEDFLVDPAPASAGSSR